jgi:hypothetical protein
VIPWSNVALMLGCDWSVARIVRGESVIGAGESG